MVITMQYFFVIILRLLVREHLPSVILLALLITQRESESKSI